MNNVDTVTTLHLRNEAQFFTFQLEKDGDLYAINIFKIKEIVKYNHELVDIMSDVPFVEGLIVVRDYNIPVIDMRKWFYYREGVNINLDNYGIPSDDKIIMICDFSGILVGIRVYSAQRILTKKWSEITRNDDDNNPSQKVIGHTKYFDNSIVQIVDIEKMAVEAFPWIDAEKEAELERVEELNEDLIDVSAANRDGEAKEANDESEIMSNEPNQDEINVISALEDVPTLNVDEQMLEEESIYNKAEEPSEEAAESTNLPGFLSTETAEEQEEIFSNQSMPVPEKAKNQVVVIQSFKKYLSGGSSTDDDGVNASDIKTNIDAENKTKPKVRPSIKELKNDLILLSKLIKAAPRREKKNSDQKQSQF